MSKTNLRTCCVCHGEYSFCLCNPEDRVKPSWYFAYCSENCRDIYKTTSDYEDKRISANEAKVQLNKLDLSKIATFGESYKNTISKINDNIISTEVVSDEQIVENIEDNTIVSVEVNEEEISNKYSRKPKLKKAKTDEVIE